MYAVEQKILIKFQRINHLRKCFSHCKIGNKYHFYFFVVRIRIFPGKFMCSFHRSLKGTRNWQNGNRKHFESIKSPISAFTIIAMIGFPITYNWSRKLRKIANVFAKIQSPLSFSTVSHEMCVEVRRVFSLVQLEMYLEFVSIRHINRRPHTNGVCAGYWHQPISGISNANFIVMSMKHTLECK